MLYEVNFYVKIKYNEKIRKHFREGMVWDEIYF